MVGPGMVEFHPVDTEFDLECDPAVTALSTGEDGTVVGEHSGRDSPSVKSFPEAGDNLRAGGGPAGVAAQTEPGVVVKQVEDRDLGVIGQLPVSDVGLPTLIGLVSTKRSPRRSRPLLRLGSACCSIC